MNIYQEAFDSLPIPLLIVGQDKQCLFANLPFCEFLAIRRTEDNIVDLSAIWPDVHAVSISPGEFKTELVLERGEKFAVRFHASNLGEDVFLLTLNATVNKQQSVGNLQSQRLATLGMLAGGVAHDFNNILTGILGHVSYLNAVLPNEGQHAESLTAIEEGAKKGSSLVSQIMSFSKLEIGEKTEVVSINELIKKTSSLLRGALTTECKLVTELPTDSPVILANEGKVSQVLINLVMNSRDAIKQNGVVTVTVTIENDESVLQRVLGTSEIACKRFVVLTVKDNGCGIPKENLDKIFEPFFSTKKDKGTGLGLATVAELVRSFGGAVEVDSTINVGTQVFVYLPSIEPQKTIKTKKDPKPNVPCAHPGEAVLVVDDESQVRNVLHLALEHLGYEVVLAESGLEALDIYAAREDGFSLVLLDMLMPQLSGEKTFAALREIDPTARILLISGFVPEEVVQKTLQAGALGFVPKPFAIDELARRVRLALDGHV